MKKRHGLRRDPVESIFSRSMQEPNSGCWLFEGVLNQSGYGFMSVADMGEEKLAHRISYRAYVGRIPDGMFVLHKCDMPSCVNPEHLFLGTHQDNMIDRSKKGRAKTGVRWQHSKKADAIKDFYATLDGPNKLQRVAKEFGMVYATAARIVNG